jgi:hypothetical protein
LFGFLLGTGNFSLYNTGLRGKPQILACASFANLSPSLNLSEAAGFDFLNPLARPHLENQP